MGDRCETNIDDCASTPCMAPNTVRCIDGEDSYTCDCKKGGRSWSAKSITTFATVADTSYVV